MMLMNMSPANAQPPDRHVLLYDRPTSVPHQSRSVTMARGGMVATSHPLAAQAGVDVLRSGGNAVDAAIAANAMLGVVEPMSCGVGGDLFVLYWDNKTQRLYGLNASGRSPYALSRQVFEELGLEQIPTEGPLSWSVPGCVSGWEELQRRFGRKTLADVLAPAIAYAEEGFPVTEVIARYWKAAEQSLARWPDAARTFLVHGRAPRAGEVFRNPRLARTYRLLAEHGAAAFYQGEIARALVDFSRQNGGYFELRDLADHTNTWVDPVSTTYRGYEVWQLPPPGQGIAVLQMLNLLEPYDLRALGPGHPQYLHYFIEAKKLAYADRARYYADPEFARVPVAELISKTYAEKRRARIDPDRAALDVPAGDPRLGMADTVYITAVDADRNCCSLIQSNYFGFGSKMVPGELGFALQNRGALFALDPEHPNTLQPHKRPFHTIIPGMVTRDGRPVFCFGVMGGDMQPQGQVQVLINIIDFGMNVQQAGDAARVQHFGSATPTGLPAQGGGTVAVESGISAAARAELEKRGHRVVSANGAAMGGYQGIWIDWEHGVLHGATEPRKDGAAVGY
jgi:gamma-glutamyltranspeptidase/glutathione hydrolase